MATPIQLDELDPVSSLSAGAAVAVVQGNDTLRTTPAAFVNDAKSYTPAGTGGIAEPVATALGRIVHSAQYNSQANYEAARDALTGTTGVNNLDVSGNLDATGNVSAGNISTGNLVVTGTITGAIAESLIDAKGDLIVGTANNTAARLAAGTDEHRLVADSAQTGGLKYVPDTTNYVIQAKGDVLVGTAAGTLARKAVGADGTVLAADSTSADGVSWAVTGFTTGDVKLTIKTAADTGWVLMNDGTIGNAASGGTTRANADTVALFTLLWNNTADAQCAVSTGRGASAAADYAANKTIALPKALGRALAVYGSGATLTARVLAQIAGAETHTLSTAEMPSHTHVQQTYTGAGGVLYSDAVASNATPQSANTPTQATGGGGAHNNMQPTLFLNVMIKL